MKLNVFSGTFLTSRQRSGGTAVSCSELVSCCLVALSMPDASQFSQSPAPFSFTFFLLNKRYHIESLHSPLVIAY